MFKPVTLLGMAVIAILAYAVYHVENQVQDKKSVLSELRRKTKNDRETIRVLKAEWVYLNRPERLKEMAGKLGLDYISAGQIKDIDSIPMRAVAISSSGNAESTSTKN